MDEDSRTLWCGNLSSRATESLLYELFLQGGPVERVNIPKDRDGTQKSFGFIVYKHPVSVPYAMSLYEGTSLFNRPLSLKARQIADQAPPPQLMPYNENPQNMNHFIQYGNQMMLGHPMSNMVMNMAPMFLPPGMIPYPSQGLSAPQMAPHMKDDRRNTRNHPYNRERERDRDRDKHSERGQRNHRDHRSHRINDYHRSNARNYR